MSIQREIVRRLYESRMTQLDDEDVINEAEELADDEPLEEPEPDDSEDEELEESEHCTEDEEAEEEINEAVELKISDAKVGMRYVINPSYLGKDANTREITAIKDVGSGMRYVEFKYPDGRRGTSSPLPVKDRLGYLAESTQVLKESWPPILNSLPSGSKNNLRKLATKKGIDLDKNPYEVTHITNGRDPRLKGDDMVIFELPDIISGRSEVAIWYDGKFLENLWVPMYDKYINSMSWKQILEVSKRISVLKFTEKDRDNLRGLQSQRMEDKKGMPVRYTQKTKPKYVSLDKSGYIIDPNKYKKMFAEMQLSNPQKVMSEAAKMYAQLATKIDKIDWETDNLGNFHSYSYIMKEIPQVFADMTRELKKYEEYTKKRDDSSKNKVFYNQFVEFAENNMKSYLQKLNELTNEAKRYL